MLELVWVEGGRCVSIWGVEGEALSPVGVLRGKMRKHLGDKGGVPPYPP